MDKYLGTLVLLVLAVGLTVGGALPIQILYASSGSMEPVISEGDLYFVVESSDIQESDIVAFDSSQYDEYVTHRVVDETDEGYITRGDANPSTDQAAGHPPISDRMLIGEVVEVGGAPLTIPGVGPTIAALKPYKLPLLLGLIGLLFVPELWRLPGERTRPSRRIVRVGDVLHPLIAVALVVCVFMVFWGASVHDVTYVATTGSATAPQTVPVGEATVKTLELDTYVPPLTTTVVEARGVEILDRTVRGSVVELTVRVPAQATPGPIYSSVSVHAYPSTLPEGWLVTLDGVHWLVAALGSMIPIFVPVFGLYAALVVPDAPLRWPRNRWLRSMGGK
jgi:signal peptidase